MLNLFLNFQNYFLNILIFFLIFWIILMYSELFWNIVKYDLKYCEIYSEVLRICSEIFWNIVKYILKNYEYGQKHCEIFSETLWNMFWNILKYCEILWNMFWNIVKYFLKYCEYFERQSQPAKQSSRNAKASFLYFLTFKNSLDSNHSRIWLNYPESIKPKQVVITRFRLIWHRMEFHLVLNQCDNYK